MFALIRFGILLVVLGLAEPAGAVTCGSNVNSKCECNSLFAYRVLELAHDLGAAPADCAAPLGVDVGSFTYNGGLADICTAAQTANGCRDTWYASPPVVADLGNPGRSHRAKFLPRCADGTGACVADEVVCQDGMRPMVYMDKAVDMAGNDMLANGWVFFLGGEGAPCADVPALRSGFVTSSCWNNYRFGGRDNKNEFKNAMSSMHPDFRRVDQSIAANGLMDDIAAFGGGAYNNFRHFNRIKVERCTDWASDTEAMATVEPFTPALWGTRTIASQVPVWHRGLNHWRALFHSLTTTAGRDIDDDGTPDLPTLANATTVLLAGSSDSTNWLISAADELRAELQSISPTVEVKIVVDGYFEPLLENEARYNGNPWGGDLFTSSLFDNPLAELLPVGAMAAAGRTYSNGSYAAGGNRRLDWDGRNTFLDASCVLSHPGDPMQCYDARHVLLNHVDTDFFIFAEQNDSVVGRFIGFADDPNYRPTALTWRARVRDQAEDIEVAWGSRSEESALLTPANPNRSYFLPWGTRHTHLGDNAQMGKKMTECTDDGAGGWLTDTQPIAEVLHRWLIYGTSFFAIEDHRGAGVATSPHWVTGGAMFCGHPRQDDGVRLP